MREAFTCSCSSFDLSTAEIHDKVTEGKYTVGLAQESIAVVPDCEDVISMCMTVVSSLLERTGTDPACIGRLEVGSETILDKSKSIKSYLMQLFPTDDLCGADNLNACYGGTAALLNSVAWLESSEWDGRLALVVAGDVAVYERGPARPTGGAGAIALLLGPNAPLVVERGTTSHYMKHKFDFYKPVPTSEYPLVDGPASIVCYMEALDACYNRHLDRISNIKNTLLTMDDFDYFVFHSPFGKLVQKAYGRLLLSDALRYPQTAPVSLHPYLDAVAESASTSRELDRLLQDLTRNAFEARVGPTRLISAHVGNSYCASLYVGLLSLLAHLQHHHSEAQVGKRIGMFSYGSGLAASMFSLIVVGDLRGLTRPIEEYKHWLLKRERLTASEFEMLLEERERLYLASNWRPVTSPCILRPGTWYLSHVDEKYRRYYARLHHHPH